MRPQRTQLKFAIIGSINTAIDFALLFILVAFGTPTIVANIISTGIPFIFSFFANRSYTFGARAGSILKQMILFVVFTLFGLWVLQPAVIFAVITYVGPWLASWLNSSGILFVGKLTATAFSLTWNYIMYARVVFRTSADATPLDTNESTPETPPSN